MRPFLLLSFAKTLPLILSVALSLAAHANEAVDMPEFPNALLNKSVQHDINPELFDHFWDNWQMATTRWRKDNKELRFTYANPLAWETMKSGKFDYPTGSVLTKMGVHVMEDPLFPNSQVPSRRVNRVQIMLKDPAHPKAPLMAGCIRCTCRENPMA